MPKGDIIKRAIIYLYTIGLFVILTSATVSARDDWQHWNAYSFNYKLSDRVKFVLNPSLRLRDDISQLFYWQSRQGFSFKLNDNIDLALHYLYADNKSTKGKWTEEHRVEVQPTLKWKSATFNFSDRNRLEYRSVGGKEKWRYRNRIKIARPTEIMRFSSTPFVSNEFFYDFKKEEYNQNRAAVGLYRKITDKVGIEIYYMVRSDKTGKDWSDVHILGTTLKYSF